MPESLREKLNQKLGLEIRNLELAESLWSQTKGLMFRESLPKNHALLMDFGKPRKPGIWMLFMRFPIDILFLDEKLNLVDRKKNARPLGLDPRTWKVYHPKRKARYVLEVNPD